MKIRILSFQNAYNYGAVLQAYGLQQTIKSLGFEDVKFINYNPKYLSNRYNPFMKDYIFPDKSFKGILSWFIRYPFFLIGRLYRNHIIRGSINELLDQTPDIVIDEKGLSSIEADILICGSDQIWNTALTGDFDKIFLGYGPYKRLGRVASYAPSTELSSFSEEKAQQLCKLLGNFEFVSVRESQVRDVLHKYFAKEITVCVDPTVLCGAESFHRITSPRLEKRDYIMVYAYNPYDDRINEMIKTIPQFEKFPVHIVLLGGKNFCNFFDCKVHGSISVQDFLSYIKYAKYVVTNSFHGLAFSLLFQKNFNVSYYEGMYVRNLSLLQQLGLDSRFIRDISHCTWNDIDYVKVNNKVAEIRETSLSYLKKILEK